MTRMPPPTAPPAPDDSVRPRAGTGADIGAALGLLLAEVLVLAGILAVWIDSGFTLDPEADAEFDRLGGYLVAAALVGGGAVLAAVVATRNRAPVTAWSQALMVVLITVGICGGTAYQRHEDERARTRESAAAWAGREDCDAGGEAVACAVPGR